MIKNLKALYTLVRPYRGKIWLAVILGSVSGAATGGGVVKGAEILFTQIFDRSQSLPDSQIYLIAAAFPVLFTFIGITAFASGYLLNEAGLGAIRDLRSQLFSKLQHLPLAYFQASKTGDLISRITADTQMLQVTINYIARNVIAQPAMALTAVFYLAHKAYTNEGVTDIYLSLLILPVVIFPIRIFSRKLERKARSQQEELGSLTNNIAQNLNAAREVRAFNLQDRENQRFADRIADLFRAQMKVVKYSYSLGPVVEILSSVGLAIAFVIGYKQGVDGGVFTGIFLALYFTYTSIKKLATFSGELYKGVAALHRIREVEDEPITIKDPDVPTQIDTINGEVEFRDVSFSYGDTPALENVSIRVQRGDVCALVGPSGAGKSTFANLIPRFYDVSSGGIFIDGLDTRHLRLKDLRDHVAIVSQEPVLFDDTILENIRLGRQNATDSEVREAARQAFADDFVSDTANFPDGYNTIVGERGARLSGGQKQRIAIARAFLRDAPILILDEATSALDSESERIIQQALEKLVVGKTVFIIAHRFSTIKDATRIIVLEGGRIVDSGSHAELYDRCKLYKKLYEQQS